MWLGVQATVACGACGATTGANAAIETIHCTECAAELQIHPDLWASVLSGAVERGLDMDVGGVDDRSLGQQGTRLSLRVRREDPACPACSTSLGTQEPRGSGEVSCPGCGDALHHRTLQDVDAVLMGEDRSLLAGQRREDLEPQRIQCTGCGAPVHVDGTTRSPTCTACDAQIIVPDEVWRRLHAPTSVAKWFVYSDRVAESSFSGSLGFSGMTIGPDGVIYAVGFHDSEDRVFAFDPARRQLVWSHPYESMMQPHVLRVGDTVWVADGDRLQIARFDTASGRALDPIQVTGGRGVNALADGGADTILISVYPECELRRLDAAGSVLPLWPPPSLWGRLMSLVGGGGYVVGSPTARPTRLAQGVAYLIGGRGGTNAILCAHDTVRYGMISQDGSLEDQGSLPLRICSGIGEIAPDGTLHLVGGRDGESVWVRIKASDQSEPLALTHEQDHAQSGVGLLDPCLAIGPDGDVWFGGISGLERFDRDGKLKWSLNA